MAERLVVLVCGPPCAGKTTYAQEHAQPGDRVIDMDDIARELGSGEQWDHDFDIVTEAQRLWRERVAAITPRTHIRAWIIRCAPSVRERRMLARTTAATRMELLIPDMDTLTARAMQRPNPDETLDSIARWFARYQPGRVHLVAPVEGLPSAIHSEDW